MGSSFISFLFRHIPAYSSWYCAKFSSANLTEEDRLALSNRSIRLEDKILEGLRHGLVSRVLSNKLPEGYVDGYKDALMAYKALSRMTNGK